MPTRVYAVGIAEATPTILTADAQRTVLVIQNLDTVAGTDYLYVSDERGAVTTTGIRIAPVGGSITLRRVDGEEPEKTFYLVAATAACPVRVMSLYGKMPVQVEPVPEEPNPQDPTHDPSSFVFDAPPLRRVKPIRSGYGRSGGHRV